MTSRISRADVTIRILAINDVYELTNLPRLLTLRKQLIPQPDAFVVAGDFLSPSVLSSIDQGKSIVDVFNAIGVSHVCFGNHEADLPLDIISHRIKESRFQWINTNMPSFPAFSALGQPYYQLSSSSPPSSSLSIPMSMSSIITSKCGKVSLPLIGLMSDEADMFRDGTFKGIEIESTFRHVKKAVEFYTTTNFSLFDDKTHHGNKTNNKEEEEKEGGGGGVYPNCIVPLTHQSMKADRKLSEKCALKNIFLPLIIGGHDHIPMIERHGITQNNPMGTLVVKSGSDAVNAAVIDLHFNSTCRKRYELSHIDVSLSDVNSFRSDLPAKARVARHLSVITHLKDFPLASLSHLSSNQLQAARIPTDSLLSSKYTRFRQTTMGALLAQAIKEELNTDLCVINGAPIKGDMEYDSGVVTFRELKEELPFPTKMISVNMPGSVLQDAIYYSRTSGQEGQERRGFLQVDIGVVIEGQYDWLKDEPEELVHSQEHKDHRILSIGGKAFSEQNTYNVALPRNLLNGFCTIKPLMKWAEEVKLRQEAAQQLMDPERLSEAVWENEWFNYGRGKPHDGHDESHIASSSSSSRDTRNKNNTNMSSDENMIKNEKNMPQVEEDDDDDEVLSLKSALKALRNGSDEKKLIAASRAIPSEDAFLPAINIVLAYFTKAHWRDLASTFSFDDLDQDKDGHVSRREVALAYAASHHGQDIPPMLLDSMMKILDLNGNDTIDREEYKSLSSFRSMNKEEDKYEEEQIEQDDRDIVIK